MPGMPTELLAISTRPATAGTGRVTDSLIPAGAIECGHETAELILIGRPGFIQKHSRLGHMESGRPQLLLNYLDVEDVLDWRPQCLCRVWIAGLEAKPSCIRFPSLFCGADHPLVVIREIQIRREDAASNAPAV